jgi:REP element-mobilizing transposase RayT
MSLFKVSLEHGGDIGKGKRKEARPLSTKHPIHVVFRMGAVGLQYSLLRKENRKIIEEELDKWAKHFGIKVYERGLQGNHCHLVIRGFFRQAIQNFLRVFAGQVARRLIERWGALPQRLWEKLCYSRILYWGRDFLNAICYVIQNELEGRGLAYTVRGKRCTHPQVEVVFKQRLLTLNR